MALLLGLLVVILGYLLLTTYLQESAVAAGSAIFGVGLIELLQVIALRPKSLAEELRDAVRHAFAESTTLQEDGLRLGLSRILISLAEVKNQVPLEDRFQNAETVYILGTTISRTSVNKTIFQKHSNTQFRFIFAALEPEAESKPTLERAQEIIHDSEIRPKLEASLIELKACQRTLPNVHFKQLSCVPTFSAVLVLGRDEAGNREGWLQVDHYLMRTQSTDRLWLVLDDPQSPLFERYHKVIADMWAHPESYDVARLT